MNGVTENFNQIAMLPDSWDHNKHYEKHIINLVYNDCYVLDIGCGTGELAKSLSKKAKHIDAIDVSPTMIEQAKKRHPAENINYMVQDFYNISEEIKYDCIVSVAAFHHLDLATALPKVKELLKDDGIFIVLDLYERKGIIDFILDCAAVPSNIVLKLVHNKTIVDDEQEKKLWMEHSKYDEYDTFEDLKKIYSEKLSNSIFLKRFLFWRYFLVYKKEREK